MGFGGKVFLRYDPSKACLWIMIGALLEKEVGVQQRYHSLRCHRKHSATGVLLHLSRARGCTSVGSLSADLCHCRIATAHFLAEQTSGGPKGGHLRGGHLKMGFRTNIRTRHVDFALKFALDMSILTALSEAIPQRERRPDRESAVWTAPCAGNRHFEMSWFKIILDEDPF